MMLVSDMLFVGETQVISWQFVFTSGAHSWGHFELLYNCHAKDTRILQ